jgi:hypothetical protein
VGRLEKHAEWNDLMGHPTQDILGVRNIFAGAATFYPGDDLTFTFVNTSTPLETFWVAFFNYMDDTGPLTTGGDFYNYFVLGLVPAANSSTTATHVDDSTVARRQAPDPSSDDDKSWSPESFGAYPSNPDIVQTDLLVNGGGVVTGYFLEDISTGVLSIPTFEQYGDGIGNFSSTVAEFIQGAKDKKLQKVIIDLQQNPGGTVVLAYDTFAQFFPQTEPFAGSRRRSHPLANVVGTVTTAWWDTLDPNDATEVDDWEIGITDEWVITPRLNAETGKNFENWDEYAGPKTTLGDQFSLVVCSAPRKRSCVYRYRADKNTCDRRDTTYLTSTSTTKR